MRTLTEDHVICFLEDTAMVFNKISTVSVDRSFPRVERRTSKI